MNAQNVVTNDLARVFIFPRGVNICAARPVYGDCFTVEGLSQDNGDVTRVECPDPRQYGKFIEVGVIRGEIGRLTTTINRRMTMNEVLLLRSMFDDDCPVDIHFHWGRCTDPTAFNQYMQAWILENVLVTNWSTDTTIAGGSGDRAPVNEAVDISAGSFYQVLATLKYSARVPAMTTDPIVDVALCDTKACSGDACPPSTGCDKYYAISNLCFIYGSLDGGDTWTSHTIPAPNCFVDDAPTVITVVGISCLGPYVVILFSDQHISYIRRDSLDFGGTDWTSIDLSMSTDIPTTIDTIETREGPVSIILTTNGNIYGLDQFLTLTLLDGTAGGGLQLNDVASNGNIAVVVGHTGTVLYFKDGVWSEVVTAPTAVNLFSALVKTDKNWYVGGASGELWCTADGGCSWTRVLFPGFAGTTVNDLCLSNTHVLWMTAGGDLYRSIDGGSTWVQEPNDSTPGCRTAVAALGDVTKLACCAYNPNKIVAVGTSNAGADGLIMLGQP